MLKQKVLDQLLKAWVLNYHEVSRQISFRQIARGHVKLKNVQIVPERIQENSAGALPIALEIVSCSVGDVDVTIPWGSLGTVPTVVRVSKVQVEVTVYTPAHAPVDAARQEKCCPACRRFWQGQAARLVAARIGAALVTPPSKPEPVSLVGRLVAGLTAEVRVVEFRIRRPGASTAEIVGELRDIRFGPTDREWCRTAKPREGRVLVPELREIQSFQRIDLLLAVRSACGGAEVAAGPLTIKLLEKIPAVPPLQAPAKPSRRAQIEVGVVCGGGDEAGLTTIFAALNDVAMGFLLELDVELLLPPEDGAKQPAGDAAEAEAGHSCFEASAHWRPPPVAAPVPSAPLASATMRPPEASQMAEEKVAGIRVGQRVRLAGLKGKPELNGQEATVSRWSVPDDCWLVHMDNGQKLAIAADNLEADPEAEENAEASHVVAPPADFATQARKRRSAYAAGPPIARPVPRASASTEAEDLREQRRLAAAAAARSKARVASMAAAAVAVHSGAMETREAGTTSTGLAPGLRSALRGGRLASGGGEDVGGKASGRARLVTPLLEPPTSSTDIPLIVEKAWYGPPHQMKKWEDGEWKGLDVTAILRAAVSKNELHVNADCKVGFYNDLFQLDPSPLRKKVVAVWYWYGDVRAEITVNESAALHITGNSTHKISVAPAGSEDYGPPPVGSNSSSQGTWDIRDKPKLGFMGRAVHAAAKPGKLARKVMFGRNEPDNEARGKSNQRKEPNNLAPNEVPSTASNNHPVAPNHPVAAARASKAAPRPAEVEALEQLMRDQAATKLQAAQRRRVASRESAVRRKTALVTSQAQGETPACFACGGVGCSICSPETQAQGICPGCRVRVCDLPNVPTLNGAKGHVRSATSGRPGHWEVEIDGGLLETLREENIEELSEPDEDDRLDESLDDFLASVSQTPAMEAAAVRCLSAPAAAPIENDVKSTGAKHPTFVEDDLERRRRSRKESEQLNDILKVAQRSSRALSPGDAARLHEELLNGVPENDEDFMSDQAVTVQRDRAVSQPSTEPVAVPALAVFRVTIDLELAELDIALPEGTAGLRLRDFRLAKDMSMRMADETRQSIATLLGLPLAEEKEEGGDLLMEIELQSMDVLFRSYAENVLIGGAVVPRQPAQPFWAAEPEGRRKPCVTTGDVTEEDACGALPGVVAMLPARPAPKGGGVPPAPLRLCMRGSGALIQCGPSLLAPLELSVFGLRVQVGLGTNVLAKWSSRLLPRIPMYEARPAPQPGPQPPPMLIRLVQSKVCMVPQHECNLTEGNMWPTVLTLPTVEYRSRSRLLDLPQILRSSLCSHDRFDERAWWQPVLAPSAARSDNSGLEDRSAKSGLIASSATGDVMAELRSLREQCASLQWENVDLRLHLETIHIEEQRKEKIRDVKARIAAWMVRICCPCRSPDE